MGDDTLPTGSVDYLIRKWKWLASWEDPNESMAAMFIVTFGFWYLMVTDATFLNLALWASVIAYLCFSFAQTIWPEMRSEEKIPEVTEDGFVVVRVTDENGDVIPESEISTIVNETKNYYTILRDLRKDSPGIFCVFSSAFFTILSYVGRYITLLPFAYLIMIGGLVLPIIVKKIKKELPWMKEVSEKNRGLLMISLQNGWEWAKIEGEARANVLKEWANFCVACVKERTNRHETRAEKENDHDLKNGIESKTSVVEDVKEDERSVAKISVQAPPTYEEFSDGIKDKSPYRKSTALEGTPKIKEDERSVAKISVQAPSTYEEFSDGIKDKSPYRKSTALGGTPKITE